LMPAAAQLHVEVSSQVIPMMFSQLFISSVLSGNCLSQIDECVSED
jgi:hypothetical protein